LLTLNEFDSKLESWAAFGNAEYQINEKLSVMGGVRYTETKQEATYCYNDPPEDALQGTATVFSVLETLFAGVPYNQILTGECFVLGDGLAGTTFGIATRTPFTRDDLDESNVSFRFGANYRLDQGTLLYANISQGYKAGVYSAIGASGSQQYAPAVEEKVIAYEVGFKAPFADGRVNLNGSVFYYDYKNKQVRGFIADPVWGLLEKMVNVPESYVFGAEFDLVWRPIDGLTISAAGAYLEAEVDGTFDTAADGNAVFNAQGFAGDFDTSTLPFTPEFTANVDVHYAFPISATFDGFIGGTVVHTGSQNTTYTTGTLPANEFAIDSWTTLDLRAGVVSSDGKWKATLFGRNVTDEFYVTSVAAYLGTRQRFVGRPATYGASIDYSW
jgi:outer membrane receptor protein involved in Fe transport